MGAFALRVLVPIGAPTVLLLQAPASGSMPKQDWQRISVLVRGAGFVQLNNGSLQQIPSDSEWTLVWEYVQTVQCSQGRCSNETRHTLYVKVVLMASPDANTTTEVELDNFEVVPVLTEASADPAHPGLYEVDVAQTDPWLRAATDTSTANILQKPSASMWAALALSVHVSPPPSQGSCSVRPVILADVGGDSVSLLGLDGLDGMQYDIQAGADMCVLSLPLAAANSRGRIGLLLGAGCIVNTFHGFAGPNTARFACACSAGFPHYRPQGQACARCWTPSTQDQCPAGEYVLGCYTEAPPGRHAGCQQCGHRIFPGSALDFVPLARRAYHCKLGCRPGSVASEAPDCVLCGKGFYSSATGQTVCSSCHGGSLALAVGGACLDTCNEAPSCGRGETFDVSIKQCTPCPAGTYKDNSGREECTSCPARSTTHARGGALSVAECVFCTRHAFWSASGGCAPCPVCEMIANSWHHQAEQAPLHYYSCSEEEYATRGARLQHGAHLAALRSTLAAARVCWLRDSTQRLALPAARANSVQAFAARKAQGLCDE